MIGISIDGTWLARLEEDAVTVLDVTADGLSAGRVIARHPGASSLAAMMSSDRIATRDDAGEIRIWDVETESLVGAVQGPAGQGMVTRFDRSGTLLSLVMVQEGGEMDHWALHVGEMKLRSFGRHRLSDHASLDPVGLQVALPARPGTLMWGRLRSPDGTEPIELQMGNVRQINVTTFHPSGDWVVSPMSGAHAWPLARPYPFEGGLPMASPAFSPSGESVAGIAGGRAGRIVDWPLDEFFSQPVRTIAEVGRMGRVVWSHDGSRLLGSDFRNRAGPILVSVADGTMEPLPDGFVDQTSAVAFSPNDRYALAAAGQFDPDENVAKVWDLETLELIAAFDPEERLSHNAADFISDEEALVGTFEGLYRWNFKTGETTRILDGRFLQLEVSDDGSVALVGRFNNQPGYFFSTVDLATGVETVLTTHGQSRGYDLSPGGDIVATRSDDGVIRVGRSDNSEPHLMFSEGQGNVAIDPLGRWVLSNGTFWPMPDLDQPPLHTLPLEELVAKLHSLTNFRIVPDPEGPTGWALDTVPFPGWEVVPTW
jgi:WD40 repeat protein